MTNMVAQAPDNNQGPWAELENYLRTLLPAEEVYIVAGGAGTGGTGSNGVYDDARRRACDRARLHLEGRARAGQGAATTCPASPRDANDRSDHAQHSGHLETSRGEYPTTVDAVETLTGYDFYSDLLEPTQGRVEAGTNGNNPSSIPITMACRISRQLSAYVQSWSG